MKIAFLLYPTEGVKPDEDSSLWIIRELVRRGHEVFHFESHDLLSLQGTPHAYLRPSRVDTRKGYRKTRPGKNPVSLRGFDCLFIRKEPPFDAEYLHALQLLELLREDVFLLNDPRGIALCNEKLFILNFERFIPETIVSQDPSEAGAFIRRLGRPAVVKRLTDKGGVGIFLTGPRDKNLASLLELATDFGQTRVLVQRYITADRSADKRILVLNGKILGAFLRRPSSVDFRANLSTGGSMHRAAVTNKDRDLADALRPKLAEYGLHFVGLDVIGGYLTEVNVTSPAGIPEINHFNRTKLEVLVADFIEGRCRR